jgi:hypothetical protein
VHHDYDHAQGHRASVFADPTMIVFVLRRDVTKKRFVDSGTCMQLYDVFFALYVFV